MQNTNQTCSSMDTLLQLDSTAPWHALANLSRSPQGRRAVPFRRRCMGPIAGWRLLQGKDLPRPLETQQKDKRNRHNMKQMDEICASYAFEAYSILQRSLSKKLLPKRFDFAVFNPSDSEKTVAGSCSGSPIRIKRLRAIDVCCKRCRCGSSVVVQQNPQLGCQGGALNQSLTVRIVKLRVFFAG